MPTLEYKTLWYKDFGVEAYHSKQIYGAGVKVYVVDTGLLGHTADARDTNGSDGPLVRSLVLPKAVSPDASRAQTDIGLGVGPGLQKHPKSPVQPAKATHGSFVTSILAKRAEGPNDVPGVAPDATVYLSDVTGPDGNIYTAYLVKALEDAISLDVDIVSMSLGTDHYDAELDRVMQRAHDKGLLVLAASGNCGCRAYEYPAALETAISVASMDRYRGPSSFNTRNDAVTVFAPGHGITVPGATTKISGSSFAVPFAAGLVALELSKRRRAGQAKARMTRLEAIQFLRSTLGLTCDMHNYAANACLGPSVEPRGLDLSFRTARSSDATSWALIAIVALLLLAYWAYIARARAIFAGRNGRVGSKGPGGRMMLVGGAAALESGQCIDLFGGALGPIGQCISSVANDVVLGTKAIATSVGASLM
jgi:subtilisin family serine protease